MQYALVFAAIAEFATGVALVLAPALVARLLLGEDLSATALPIARVLGFALIGLGVACWPGPPRAGMLTYSGLVTLFLGYGGITGNFVGIMLWPAVVLHAVLTILLLSGRRAAAAQGRQQDQH